MKNENNIFIAISQTSVMPLYEQIASQIIEKIILREIKAGALLPSIRSLARDLQISVITVKRAYEDLERDGYIATFPGKGSVVVDGGKELHHVATVREISTQFKRGIELGLKINCKKSEILEIFNRVLKKRNEED